MNGNSRGSGVLALPSKCDVLGHSMYLLESSFSCLSNEDNYPGCVLSGCCEDNMEMSKCDL